MDDPSDAREIRRRAIALLARREHSVRELTRKLEARGFDPERTGEVVDALAREGVCSDERFTESFARARVERGQGPLRIRAALRERGVDERLVDAHVAVDETVWFERARQVRIKKFGPGLSLEPREAARQSRYLGSRGFTSDQVRSALKTSADGGGGTSEQD